MKKILITITAFASLTLFAGDEGCLDVNVTAEPRVDGGDECQLTNCPIGQNFTEIHIPAERGCESGFTYKGCTSFINVPRNIEVFLYYCEWSTIRIVKVPTPVPVCSKRISPQPTSTHTININDAEGTGGVCQCPSS